VTFVPHDKLPVSASHLAGCAIYGRAKRKIRRTVGKCIAEKGETLILVHWYESHYRVIDSDTGGYAGMIRSEDVDTECFALEKMIRDARR